MKKKVVYLKKSNFFLLIDIYVLKMLNGLGIEILILWIF